MMYLPTMPSAKADGNLCARPRYFPEGPVSDFNPAQKLGYSLATHSLEMSTNTIALKFTGKFPALTIWFKRVLNLI
jgi:hypothetical protein